MLVLKLEMLDIDRLLKSDALLHGRFLEILAGAELTDDSGLFEFPLELLECSLDVLSFLDGYYDHCFTPPFSFGTTKVEHYSDISK